MIRRGRVGRPGLLGTVARTAVITGTAQATSNAMNRHAQQRAAPPPPQYEAPPAAPPLPPLPPEPSGAAQSEDDLVAKLGRLGDLHRSGVLSDEEFAAAKAKLLG
ncbi:SHOCT domain-containing protein [Rhodococcus triatomae]|uniref:Short C-terminal domain-containing protein n=1 Tax=Rhodococcus triatomae TaxID=300028 RepID=A0A1G8CVW7_9NOCA|nr:SHOCT domain-containing protein [Rhodococcus triatomae]QNG18570.1 SHOCT domain-containing protein [Rhodococcus triatomae]QNG21761.1 SHOCT domain-containing protein [Rhodococcus triatomae]SDH49474.1 Short C-terminal domain-containing protein [Rhodococcus triatomae]